MSFRFGLGDNAAFVGTLARSSKLLDQCLLFIFACLMCLDFNILLCILFQLEIAGPGYS